ncbi:hypothetical protein TRVA0_014S00364 [Trichomonascus vanleenenianus]|uniref:arrestin C-terminal domain-containing protein n=1 Tax=Trichomonascus vanleenenianus TaxID=2268995 RepID=UPI003ECB3C0D
MTEVADICSYCAGKPRTLVSSHSGCITVAVSLQEPIVFLANGPTQGPSSYREHDRAANGVATAEDARHHEEGSSGSSPPGPPPPIDEEAVEDEPSSSGLLNTGFFHRNRANSSNSTCSVPPQHHYRERSASDAPPAIISGSVLLKLTKPTKLKSLSLSFYGKCKTSWNQAPGSPFDEAIAAHPLAEIQDELIINTHNWEFLPHSLYDKENPMYCTQSPNEHQPVSYVFTDLYGADVARFKNDPDRIWVKDPKASQTIHRGCCQVINHHQSQGQSQQASTAIPVFTSEPDCKKKPFPNSSHRHEGVIVPAGEYVYNFTLAIDPKVPETIRAPNGSLNYYLVPKVVRSGAFSMNLSGQHEVELVRSPPNNYDAMSNNPIAISRNWDDRLHYEILIPRKYISLGSSIPMAIKLTPLEKVMVHRVRVHVVETIQYTYSHEPNLSYTDRSLKILLYEKKAPPANPDPSASTGNNASASASSGHGLLHLPLLDHVKSNDETKPKKKGREKLTGNLLTYSGSYLGSREDQQAAATTLDCTLPLISEPAIWDGSREANFFTKATASETHVKSLHPDSSNCPYIKVRHRLTVSFRISKQDPEDEKRRHFEVKIDTPIHFLSRHCIKESVELPMYNFDDLSMAPLTLMNSNDSTAPTLTTYAMNTDDHLPSFDDVLSGPPPVAPPPDYEDVVTENERAQVLEHRRL